MSGTHAIAPWRQPEWLAEATAWADARLAELSIGRTGAPEQRERAWSTVLTIPTDAGIVFLKQTADAMANDATLTALLAPRAPDLVLNPLAVDAAARRMLVPDGGRLLRDVLTEHADVQHWHHVLPRYAELQRSMRTLAEPILAAGAIDRRPRAIPGLFVALLDDPIVQGRTELPGLTQDERRTLSALLPAIEAAAHEVEAVAIGPSIQHDDLHDGNVLVSRADEHLVIDWGDAQLAHPFGSLLVTLRSVADRFKVADDDPLVDRLRDTYLEVWSDAAPRSQLRRVAGLAGWMGMVGRALTWHASMATANDEERIQCAEGAVAWLREMADSVPVT